MEAVQRGGLNVRDFARLKRQGANVVRVFISFGSFFTEPGRLNPEGLSKFDQLLDLADEAGVDVHPTGPDAWGRHASMDQRLERVQQRRQ